MPVVPFIPMIASGIGTVGGLVQGHKQGKRADAMAAQTGAAMQRQGAAANTLMGAGMPLVQQSGDYYSKLLRGDRSMLRSATTPERMEISDTYRGAERSLARSGVRGAQRDYAEGELARERAGRISALAPMARAGAGAAAGNLGSSLTGQGGALLGNLVSGSLGQQQASLNRDVYSGEQSRILGENFGQLLTDFTKAWQERSGGAGRTANASVMR